MVYIPIMYPNAPMSDCWIRCKCFFDRHLTVNHLLFFQSTAINRLAAAHRGAQRALQFVINQLSDLSHSKVPPHYKELGQLIRQLSLCSAKVVVDQGSAVPETALDILQKLEVRGIEWHQHICLSMCKVSAVVSVYRQPQVKEESQNLFHVSSLHLTGCDYYCELLWLLLIENTSSVSSLEV